MAAIDVGARKGPLEGANAVADAMAAAKTTDFMVVLCFSTSDLLQARGERR